jgi:lysophospholipase L1-like esterase
LELSLRLAGYVYLNRIYREQFLDLCHPTPEDITIVCLGESSTAGLWVSYENSYPKQLERKLKAYYRGHSIKIVVPPHLGQNTSQIANRMEDYLRLYKPRLIILMAGCNNLWSFSESHILRFLRGDDPDAGRLRLFVFLDRFRIFKIIRYLAAAILSNREKSPFVDNPTYIWGGPEYLRLPARHWAYSFGKRHQEEFIEMWRYDMRMIIRKARESGVRVMMMTYHIMPGYLSVSDFVSMAAEENMPLVRNDTTFVTLSQQGRLREYLLGDYWHPNAGGYAFIAENAFSCIREFDLLGLNRRGE